MVVFGPLSSPQKADSGGSEKRDSEARSVARRVPVLGLVWPVDGGRQRPAREGVSAAGILIGCPSAFPGWPPVVFTRHAISARRRRPQGHRRDSGAEFSRLPTSRAGRFRRRRRVL